MKILQLSVVEALFFFLLVEGIFSVNIFLKRKYPNVRNGVYQCDSKGAPIKIVDVNQGHKWEIPPSEKGIDAYAVVKKNGKVKKFSEGTNIIYGTTQRISRSDVEEEIDDAEIKKEIEKNKKKGIIKNVSNVRKAEQTEKQKSELPPQAMHISAEDIPDESSEKKEEENIEKGKKLGATIKENLETHYKDSAAPSPLVEEMLEAKVPSTLEKLLMEDLEERKWLSKKIITDNICLRDYSVQCPSSWEKISEKQCRAPKDYTGPCAHVLVFEPMTAKEKSQLAVDCKINWLCINESCGNSERDYSKECPENWTYTGRCEAPENYTGGCNRLMDFDAFTQREKEEYSSICKVVWPCKEKSCERDYSITCPKGWSYNVNKDLCKAPNDLKKMFSDEEIKAISKMSYHQRMNFSSRYGIPWPCKNRCFYGYEKYPCPRGWINMMDSGVCKAPDDYTAPYNCPKITHFDYMDRKEKEEFSKKCNVKWLCIENAERDYSKCPLFFKYVSSGKDKGKCEPTQAYKGPCKESQELLSFSLEQKYNFEEICEAQFPNLQKENIVQTDREIISDTTMDKLLKGTDTENRGVTLE